jgi:hypothetical protein
MDQKKKRKEKSQTLVDSVQFRLPLTLNLQSPILLAQSVSPVSSSSLALFEHTRHASYCQNASALMLRLFWCQDSILRCEHTQR